MRIVITGATGFVGRLLVPELSRAGASLLVVGRDPAAARRLFPHVQTCRYDELPRCGTGYDMVVHLAALNSNCGADEAEFRKVNVGLLLDVLDKARQAGIPRFVNISSFHALDGGNDSPYARSKREAARILRDRNEAGVVTVYLPAVHGGRYAGRLAFLNRLPAALASRLLAVLSALRPVLHVGKLAAFIVALPQEPAAAETMLSDDLDENVVYTSTKRLVDIVAAVAILGVFWWGLLAIWASIRLLSPGPAIFAQRRVGRNGRPFTLYKFRTMQVGTMQAASHEVSQDRVTALGRILRRTKLDELPQLWNVLAGEISLVGPRPCLPGQRELIEARRRRGVLAVRPGISGLAQVNGIDMSDPERLAQWDARYVAMRSVLLDLRICAATLAGKGRGDAVGRPL